MSKIFKLVLLFTTSRGRILENIQEISDIIREHILPTIPHQCVGADLFFRLSNQGSTSAIGGAGAVDTIDTIDTIQFYRTDQNQAPLTYELICTLVAEQRNHMAPADTQDLLRLGSARDSYQVIQSQKELMHDIDEGLERGVRNEFVSDRACAARMTRTFWEEQKVQERIDALISSKTTSASSVSLSISAGGRISREEFSLLSLAYNVEAQREQAFPPTADRS